MLDRYDVLLQKLSAPLWLRQYRLGSHLKETFLIGQPAEYYGCPPALIPITSNGSLPEYEGIWMRWFCDEPDHIRRYVCAGPEDHFLLEEIALDDEQFANWLLVRALVYRDGNDEAKEIASFSKSAGISGRQFAEIDAHTLEFGDDPEKLDKLAAYTVRVPIGIGERRAAPLAISLSGLSDENANDVAYFELSEHGRSWLRNGASQLPPWLVANAPLNQVFGEYLKSGRLKEAWLTLNSTGWSIGEARSAALALARAADEPLFTLHMRAWVAFTLDEEEFIPDDELSTREYENYDY